MAAKHVTDKHFRETARVSRKTKRLQDGDREKERGSGGWERGSESKGLYVCVYMCGMVARETSQPQA